MTYDIDEIKPIRKNLGLTQSELAKRAGVSQSLITKIESGKIDPSYSSVVKIFAYIDSLTRKNTLHAEDMMQSRIITIHEEDDIREATSKMKKHGISQLPVVNDSTAVGLISESTVLDAFIERKDGLRIKDIMTEPPPIIAKDTSEDVVRHLLRFFQVVLVAERGKPIGIITKADIIQSMYG